MKFDEATWHAVRNYTKDGQGRVLGIVIHIMDGTLSGTQSWFDNSSAQASSHFGTGRIGGLLQWVDTKDRAWAQAAGNHDYLSIENEGRGGDELTPVQIESCAKVLAWASRTYGFKLQLAAKVGDEGLAYHALGGAAWGGHTSCPGARIVAQLNQILDLAKAINDIPLPLSTKPTPKPTPIYAPFPGAAFFKNGRKHPLIAAMHKRLVAEGCGKYKSSTGADTWGSGDKSSYAAWQRKVGYSGSAADGVPGKKSWDRLRVPKS